MIERRADGVEDQRYAAPSPTGTVRIGELLYISAVAAKASRVSFHRLITKEGFEHSGFTPILAAQRLRNSIAMTKSSVQLNDHWPLRYLRHPHALGFLHLIGENPPQCPRPRGRKKRDRHFFERVVEQGAIWRRRQPEFACTYLRRAAGRTFEGDAVGSEADSIRMASRVNSPFCIVYWMGKLSI
ncbi:MAG: hypothetical protein IPN76_34725, partial [Saprospiraceae bacterium]|nr:hypothetical protein [Saprospiraceae bacterium]